MYLSVTMLSTRCYYVYILTNALRTVLYTGVTNDIEQRLIEHYSQRGLPKTFTGRYYVYYLLYYEPHQYINNAFLREKEIKGWSRTQKMALINSFNPEWTFLNERLFGEWPPKELPSRL